VSAGQKQRQKKGHTTADPWLGAAGEDYQDEGIDAAFFWRLLAALWAGTPQ